MWPQSARRSIAIGCVWRMPQGRCALLENLRSDCTNFGILSVSSGCNLSIHVIFVCRSSLYSDSLLKTRLVCARVRTHETKSIICRVRLSSDYFTIEKWAGGPDPPVVILILMSVRPYTCARAVLEPSGRAVQTKIEVFRPAQVLYIPSWVI